MKKNVLMGLLSLLMLAICTVGNAQTPVKKYGQLQGMRLTALRRERTTRGTAWCQPGLA